MKINNKKVFINNTASVTCVGQDNDVLFESICLQKESISLDTTYVKDKTVAIGKIDSSASFEELISQSCQKVLDDSNLNDFSSTLLLVGSSVGGMKTTEDSFFHHKNYEHIDYKLHGIDAIAYRLNQQFDFYDDTSFSTACTSSANALGYAKEVIQKGIYNNVLVVGVDSLCHTTVCGFSALSVLSSKPCTPFELNREGMNVSEGIGILLLQDIQTQKSIELCGVGYSSDAHHMTQPHPEGQGARMAMEKALNDAQLHSDDIDYINAHGTGTQANDAAEAYAIENLFPHKPFVSSTKSYTGHTLGAAGAIEAIISSLVIEKSIIPPSKKLLHAENKEINFSNEVIHKAVSYVLSNSFAFGGNNTSLILGRCDDH